MDSLDARIVSGTEDGTYPFWSPDSRFIGFFAGGKLKKADIAGGPALTICDAQDGRGGTWNQQGVILFTPNFQEVIYRVSAAGGMPAPITKLNDARHETTHRYPYFLPDGKHFLYLAANHQNPRKAESNAIYVASLDGKENKVLVNAGSNAGYANELLLFVREKVLMGQRFDPSNLKLQGDPFAIAQKVYTAVEYWRGAFSVSGNGILTYFSGTREDTTQLAWFDRSGKQIEPIGDRALYHGFSLSLDAKKAAVVITDPDSGTDDIWLYELSRGVRTRFTFGSSNEHSPVWSPDGTRIVFDDDRRGNSDVFQKLSSGAGTEEPLVQSDASESPYSWSADGRFLCYIYRDPKGKTKQDLWILPLFGDRKPFPFLKTEFNEVAGSFSPDGKWISYMSDESGKFEIYAAPFVAPASGRFRKGEALAASGVLTERSSIISHWTSK